MSDKAKREYVLGTSDEELVRLGFQHRVWGEHAYAVWERAGFAPGQTILDVGCGPGFATVDLARIVGSSGRIIAVDESERFLEHLTAQVCAQGIHNVEMIHADVTSMSLVPESVDGAYARWVLCFVKEPMAVVNRVASALRPGGVFAVQDYFNYRAIALAPRSVILEKVIDAVEARWRGHGGDPDVAARLPSIMRKCGLELREIRPISRVARPGSALWNWPTTFFRNFVPLLVGDGLLTPADQLAFENEWTLRANDPDTFLCTPPVYDVIAVKH